MLTYRTKYRNLCAFKDAIVRYSSTKTSEITIEVDNRLPARRQIREQREPFSKNIVLGKFDYEFLAYVEPQSEDRYNNIAFVS